MSICKHAGLVDHEYFGSVYDTTAHKFHSNPGPSA
jgi:hypothetical protein